MVDFDNEVAPSGKVVAEQFIAVRQRGLLNSGLEVLAAQVKRANPGMAVRWERYSKDPSDGKDAVIMSEGMGWKVCTYADLGMASTASTPKDGLVQRGDSVLMMAPEALEREQLKQDAEMARVDSDAAKTSFDDALEQKQVRLSSGETDRAKGIGTIKSRTEFISARPAEDS